MIDFASPLLQWLHTNPQLAGLVTFLISAGESIAIIGTIVPGSVTMAAIGALVGAGIIPFWPILLWAIFGAVAGDGISYWLGFHFKDRLNNIWPFKKHPHLLISGKKFFEKHGAKSVFIGRFVGPVRAIVPLIAGMLHVKPLRFAIANITSAIGWAPLYMLPGILLGAASVELPSEIATRVILMLILGGLFIILCVWLIKKLFEEIQTQVDQFLNCIWNILYKSRYFYLITAALKHHNPKKLHGQLALGFYFILTCIALFYLLSLSVYQGSQNIFINKVIFHLFRSLRTSGADNIMLCLSFLGEKEVLLPLSLTLFAWLAYSKRMHTACHVLFAGLFATASITLAKHVAHSPRPWGVIDSGYSSHFSFPSGHTTLAIIYYVGLALLLIRLYHIPQRYHKIIYTLAGIIISAVFISRLYLGVHWLTDIIGSALLGTALLMLVFLSYNRKSEKNISPKGVIITILVTLFITYSSSVYFSFNQLKSAYTLLEWPTYTMTLKDWWSQQGEQFPLYRVNRLGLPAKIFNVQWLGDLADIQKTLLKNGWEIAPQRDWLRVLYRITAVNSTAHLPLFSPTYLDSAPVLVLLKVPKDGNKLLVLRFWNSHLIISHASQPLWMASMEFAPSTYSWLFQKKHSHENRLIPTLLFSKTPSHVTVKKTIVSVKVNNHFVNQPIILIQSTKIKKE
jgi:membrane protein DedA with SNARE-associated domain/membrane-associated phospholipid phosphatase